ASGVLIQDVLSIRKKRRIADELRRRGLRRFDEDSRRASGCRDTVQAAGEVGSKHNYIARTPRSAAGVNRVTDFHYRSTIDGHAPELALLEKAEVLAV